MTGMQAYKAHPVLPPPLPPDRPGPAWPAAHCVVDYNSKTRKMKAARVTAVQIGITHLSKDSPGMFDTRRVRVRAPARLLASLPSCLFACLPGWLNACLPGWLNACLPALLLASECPAE